MKLYVNRRPYEGPWGGGNNFVKAMYEYLPKMGFNIILDPFKVTPDIIFLQNPKPDNICNFSINEAIYLKNRFPAIEIVLRVNDCDSRKATTGVDEFWIECSKHIDKTFFVSNWMKQYFIEKGWTCKQNYVIYNGVDKDNFKLREKINNGKINIVAHHWSDNPMKGHDIYEQLDNFVSNDNEFTFTYIGRSKVIYPNSKMISPLFGLSLGEELSKYDVYISASRFDPGPNHILESLACNIPTFVHSDGGGCVEFAGENFTYESFESLQKILTAKVYKNNLFKSSSWLECIRKYTEAL